MSKLLIIKLEDILATYEKGETYNLRLTTKDNVTRTNTDTDALTIDIIDPCSTVSISAATFIKTTTGNYYHNYNIPGNAVYGEWKVVITATKDSIISKLTDNFIIMPWNAAPNVRTISGIGENKAVNDKDINKIVLDSLKEVSHSCYEYHYREKPNTCIGTCTGGICYCMNGTNTTFYTKNTPLADWNGDGVITGFGQQSCGTDINAIWIDCDSVCHQCDVTVVDSNCGRLTIYQQGTTTAIPSTAKGIYLDYYTKSGSFTNDLFKEAIEYHAAHRIILRFGELERATNADLASAQNVKYVNPNRMWKHYRKIIKKIHRPMIGGVY